MFDLRFTCSVINIHFRVGVRLIPKDSRMRSAAFLEETFQGDSQELLHE